MKKMIGLIFFNSFYLDNLLKEKENSVRPLVTNNTNLNKLKEQKEIILKRYSE